MYIPMGYVGSSSNNTRVSMLELDSENLMEPKDSTKTHPRNG